MTFERPDLAIKSDPFALGEACFHAAAQLYSAPPDTKEAAFDRLSQIVDASHRLNDMLPRIEKPASKEQLFSSELKRRSVALGNQLEGHLKEEPPTLERTVKNMGIETEMTDLRPWLEAHHEEAQDAYNNLGFNFYQPTIDSIYPELFDQALAVANEAVNRYVNVLDDMMEDATGFVPPADLKRSASLAKRSGYIPKERALQIAASKICFRMPDGGWHVSSGELLRLLGHEYMGHTRNYLMTEDSDLPAVIKFGSTQATVGTEESLALFYEHRIFEDLDKFPQILEALGIRDVFPEIKQQKKLMKTVNEYDSMSHAYALTLLSDPSFGKPSDERATAARIHKMSEVAIVPERDAIMMRLFSQSCDEQGNIPYSLFSELKYVAQPVSRTLGLLESKGVLYDDNRRTDIDTAFLKGFWTPEGFEQAVNIFVR